MNYKKEFPKLLLTYHLGQVVGIMLIYKKLHKNKCLTTLYLKVAGVMSNNINLWMNKFMVFRIWFKT